MRFSNPIRNGQERAEKFSEPFPVSALPLYASPIKEALNQQQTKGRGWERKGPPEIIQKFRRRNWPISSAD